MNFTDFENYVKKHNETSDNTEPYPLYVADVFNAIYDKRDYNDENLLNLKVHTVCCGGITYLHYGKKEVLNISRNFNRETTGITVAKFDSFVKAEDKEKLTEYICFIIYNLLLLDSDDLENEEKMIINHEIQKDKFGLYRFKLGEIEFEE